MEKEDDIEVYKQMAEKRETTYLVRFHLAGPGNETFQIHDYFHQIRFFKMTWPYNNFSLTSFHNNFPICMNLYSPAVFITSSTLTLFDKSIFSDLFLSLQTIIVHAH